jgi:hypothetical protein
MSGSNGNQPQYGGALGAHLPVQRRVAAAVALEQERRLRNPAGWPALDPAAMHGIAGEIVRSLAPFTEADPTGQLVDLLVAAGNAIGPGPHARVGGAAHPARLNAVKVGRTSRGRKGQSWADVLPVLLAADPTWAGQKIVNGLASGEGLIAAVRDADGDDVGVDDKRLLVVEPEFARVLNVAARDGNTLSAVIRESWDRGNLRVMTRRAPIAATGAHISIVGHITQDEFRRKLTDTDAANGFANRYLVVCVARSKLLPGGPAIDDDLVRDMGTALRARLEAARRVQVLRRTPDAEALWAELYMQMADADAGGLVGAITARAEAQCLRLSVAYALLDGTAQITVAHVEAAWAVWRYCEQSAAFIFGDSLGDEVADKLLAALRNAGPGGLDGTAQRDLFGRHVSGARLEAARQLLEDRGLAATHAVETGGRPRTVSVATEASEALKGVPA